ncbi:MAG: Cysteine desulfurase [Syntrophorhabdus sp. PtaU1.Bin153]|nr:MAG: Cysteine desulfurase [Syntrophorhabdus sp. PtaU1.Bin153]
MSEGARRSSTRRCAFSNKPLTDQEKKLKMLKKHYRRKKFDNTDNRETAMKTVYLDNNATTQVAREVLEDMLPYFHDYYGNPSSIHSFGGHVAKKVAEARHKVASLLGAQDDEIIFTSCGTESDNTAILSALAVNPGRKHIVTTMVEHPAVSALCERLAEKGYRVTALDVDSEGNIDMNQYERSLSDDTAVVSIMWANNETGVISPVEEAARIAHDHGILFHTDAVQAVGKIPIDMRSNAIDMLSLSGHKLHGPKGIGVLYLRKGTKFSPFMVGGHQEKDRRSGTENTASIIGLGVACDLAGSHLNTGMERIRQLRDKLETDIQRLIPNIRINGSKAHRLPNTSNISFQFVESEMILLLLDQLGICASSGSACTSGTTQPSRVLRAMGIPGAMARGAVRFSLSSYNTREEIDYVVENLRRIVGELRERSPNWKLATRPLMHGAGAP